MESLELIFSAWELGRWGRGGGDRKLEKFLGSTMVLAVQGSTLLHKIFFLCISFLPLGRIQIEFNFSP